MFDFKLKIVRFIFIVSILWLSIHYWYWHSYVDYYRPEKNHPEYWYFIAPVLLYWLGIPLYRFYHWLMEGNYFNIKEKRIAILFSILWILIVIWYEDKHIVKSYETAEFMLVFAPVWIYWIVLPIYRWIIKGK
jgi:hypothetical protein